MSIDSFKATVSKRGGIAKANRFLTIFTPPTQSLLNLDPGVIIGRKLNKTFNAKSLISDPRDIAFLCESTQIPGRSLNTLDLSAERETLKIPNGFIDDDVTMTFILTNDYYMKDMFESWMSSIVDTERYQLGYKKNYQTDIVIQQLNAFDRNVYGIRLKNAYPINIAAIELSNESENTLQKVTVTFAYDRYIPENFIESSISQTISSIPHIPGIVELPNAVTGGLNKIRSLL